jgi:glycosyltransferase involved in cell wall biosynthesis
MPAKMIGPVERCQTRAGVPAVERPDDRPLRIALVAPPYFDIPPKAYGGIEAVVADLADALTERGHHVTLIGAGRNGTRARFVPVFADTVPDRLGQPLPEVLHAALVRRAVERLAATDGLDLVHDNTLAGPLNAPVYRQLGLPTVVTMHGPGFGDDLHRLYATLGNDIHLVAISERQRQLAPALPWVGTVPNAVRAAAFPYNESKQDYALFLGRFHPEKGAHLALEAAHAAGMRLILAGKCADPAEKSYFEREIRPRLRDTDRLVGMADAGEKRRLLANAKGLLFPVQWEEPFGMVMIEAMACGTPVVALRAGAVPEVVADGVTGYVCDSPAELPRALRRLGELDPAACRRRVLDHFDITALGAGYEAVYRKVLASLSTLQVLLREYGDIDAQLDAAAAESNA